jgi:hypothetical protein
LSKGGRPKKSRKPDKTSKAITVAKRRKASGEVVNRNTVAAEAGVSTGTAQRALIVLREIEQDPFDETDPLRIKLKAWYDEVVAKAPVPLTRAVVLTLAENLKKIVD